MERLLYFTFKFEGNGITEFVLDEEHFEVTNVEERHYEIVGLGVYEYTEEETEPFEKLIAFFFEKYFEKNFKVVVPNFYEQYQEQFMEAFAEEIAKGDIVFNIALIQDSFILCRIEQKTVTIISNIMVSPVTEKFSFVKDKPVDYLDFWDDVNSYKSLVENQEDFTNEEELTEVADEAERARRRTVIGEIFTRHEKLYKVPGLLVSNVFTTVAEQRKGYIQKTFKLLQQHPVFQQFVTAENELAQEQDRNGRSYLTVIKGNSNTAVLVTLYKKLGFEIKFQLDSLIFMVQTLTRNKLHIKSNDEFYFLMGNQKCFFDRELLLCFQFTCKKFKALGVANCAQINGFTFELVEYLEFFLKLILYLNLYKKPSEEVTELLERFYGETITTYLIFANNKFHFVTKAKFGEIKMAIEKYFNSAKYYQSYKVIFNPKVRTILGLYAPDTKFNDVLNKVFFLNLDLIIVDLIPYLEIPNDEIEEFIQEDSYEKKGAPFFLSLKKEFS